MMSAEELIPVDPRALSPILRHPESFLANLEASGVLDHDYSFRPLDQKIIASINLFKKCQGPPGYIHGGLIAAILDEVMAMVLLHQGKKAVTGKLDVSYLKPTPFPASYQVEAWIQEANSLTATLKAKLLNAELVTMASAQAKFIWI